MATEGRLSSTALVYELEENPQPCYEILTFVLDCYINQVKGLLDSQKIDYQAFAPIDNREWRLLVSIANADLAVLISLHDLAEFELPRDNAEKTLD